jgi:DNA repair exonuclease SbcCD nuclease subunit
MVRFIHTSDWQLGIPQRFLNPGAQALYSRARIEMIKTIGRLAKSENCLFIAVAGDVFEYEQMDRRTVAMALKAMGEAEVPVVLLPGNHDPCHEDSVYQSGHFGECKPKNVIVLADGEPVELAEGVEVVGAPWLSKHPGGNPIIKTLDGLEPVAGGLRICLAHGYVDTRSADPDAEALIPTALLEKAVAEGKIHYAALGDRHSCDDIAASGRIRYSGTPEQTDFDEIKPGHVCLVDLSSGGAAVEERKIGKWVFRKFARQITGADDAENLLRELEALPEQDLAVIRLELSGSLGLTENREFRERLDKIALPFASVDVREPNFLVHAGDAGQLCRHLTGYAAEAAEKLRAMIAAGGEGAATARESLLLLARLAPAGED